jgi:hypothetical protein
LTKILKNKVCNENSFQQGILVLKNIADSGNIEEMMLYGDSFYYGWSGGKDRLKASQYF